MNNDLHRAFIALGLEPGASWQDVQEHYQLLAQGLHPDSGVFKSDDKKSKAEQKLKTINDARDKLKNHFLGGDHNITGPCDCKINKSFFEEKSKEDAQEKTKREAAAKKARERDFQRQAENTQTSQQTFYNTFLNEADLKNAYEYHHDEERSRLYKKISLIFLAWFLVGFGTLYLIDFLFNTQRLYEQHNEGLFLKNRKNDKEYDKYIEDKIQVIKKITGVTVGSNQASKWVPPFEDMYYKLNKVAKEQKENRYGVQLGRDNWVLPPSVRNDPEITRKAKELYRAMAYHKGQMDRWKREIDSRHAAIDMDGHGGKLQDDLEYYQNKYNISKSELHKAKQQLDNLVKAPTTLQVLTSPRVDNIFDGIK